MNVQQSGARANRMIELKETRDLSMQSVLELYRANDWSSAEKPERLLPALLNSHSLVSAWDNERLVGLANAISDGFLVVYYPHVLIHPEYQRMGIGKELMSRLLERYKGFHQHAVLADKGAESFYESVGFVRSTCTAMWIYDGNDH